MQFEQLRNMICSIEPISFTVLFLLNLYTYSLPREISEIQIQILSFINVIYTK